MRNEKILSTKWKVILFHKCLMPFYALVKMIFKRPVIVTWTFSGDEGKTGIYRSLDYVRIRTLELLADMVRDNIKSEEYSVAELGVFRGEFAVHIQNMFPKRRIYLFDTFEGFPEKDKLYDIQCSFSKKSIFEDTKNFTLTSVPQVLSNMSNPKNVVICKGFFPESITMEHKKIKWGLVSLDVDLYKPILEGLRFFYPSLCRGGYIMIHDYNSSSFLGVKKAVEDFEAEAGFLNKIPIPDRYGSLIITKSC